MSKKTETDTPEVEEISIEDEKARLKAWTPPPNKTQRLSLKNLAQHAEETGDPIDGITVEIGREYATFKKMVEAQYVDSYVRKEMLENKKDELMARRDSAYMQDLVDRERQLDNIKERYQREQEKRTSMDRFMEREERKDYYRTMPTEALTQKLTDIVVDENLLGLTYTDAIQLAAAAQERGIQGEAQQGKTYSPEKLVELVERINLKENEAIFQDQATYEAYQDFKQREANFRDDRVVGGKYGFTVTVPEFLDEL
jgi:hypothetical protein